MRKALIRKLRVFGLIVGVYKIQNLLTEQGVFGYYAPDTKKIAVDAELKGDELEITVIHEMFHAVLDRVHCAPQMSPEFAEVVIENLARAVVDNYHVRQRR